MSSHENELERRDIRIAKLAAQTGVLEDQLWSLREQLARAQRHRGAAVGLLRGALKDGALSGDYADLAARVLEQADALHAAAVHSRPRMNTTASSCVIRAATRASASALPRADPSPSIHRS